MPKITTTAVAGKAGKPRPDFPLFVHSRGFWAKKVRGTTKYFGKVADDPEGKVALELWLDRKEDLLAGRTPRAPGDGLTVRDLCNRFLSVKSGEEAAAAKARSDAAINAERPLRTPGPFRNWP